MVETFSANKPGEFRGSLSKLKANPPHTKPCCNPHIRTLSKPFKELYHVQLLL